MDSVNIGRFFSGMLFDLFEKLLLFCFLFLFLALIAFACDLSCNVFFFGAEEKIIYGLKLALDMGAGLVIIGIVVF
jgi:hypothetical protein